jgi:hypothetical protein
MLPLLLAAAQSWTFATGAAPSVSLENLFGFIRVERGREGEVSIEASVSGEDPASPGRWRLSAERARDGSIAAGATCDDSRSHDGVARCSRAAIGWVLHVPSDADVRIESVVGDIEVNAGRSISVTSVCGKTVLAPTAILQPTKKTLPRKAVGLPERPNRPQVPFLRRTTQLGMGTCTHDEASFPGIARCSPLCGKHPRG